MCAKPSTPSLSIPSRKPFSTGRNANQDITDPIGFPFWTPLEQAIVLVSPESTRKKTPAGLA